MTQAREGIKEAHGVIVSGIRVWCASKPGQADRWFASVLAGCWVGGIGVGDCQLGFFIGKDSRPCTASTTRSVRQHSTVAEHLAASVADTGRAPSATQQHLLQPASACSGGGFLAKELGLHGQAVWPETSLQLSF